MSKLPPNTRKVPKTETQSELPLALPPSPAKAWPPKYSGSFIPPDFKRQDPLTTEEERLVREFIAAVPWKFAKSYADKAPHEYVMNHVTQGDTFRAFHAFREIIKRCGYDAPFYRARFRYFFIDGYSYWVMYSEEKKSGCINRQPGEYKGTYGAPKKKEGAA